MTDRYEPWLVSRCWAIVEIETGRTTGRYFMKFGEATAECERLNRETGDCLT